MGVLYEHWRPDLNECFYVGVSTSKEQTRPYEMNNRNVFHLKIQEELKTKKLKPRVIIQAWGLTKEELFKLEKTQIAYWKNLIGDRLSNIHPGGNSGEGIKWNQESKSKQSERVKTFYSTKEGKVVFANSLPKISQKLKSFAESDKGKESYKERGRKISEIKSNSLWLLKNNDMRGKIKIGVLNYASTSKGCLDYKQRGVKIKNSLSSYFSSSKGKNAAIMHSWWLSNVKTRYYWGA